MTARLNQSSSRVDVTDLVTTADKLVQLSYNDEYMKKKPRIRLADVTDIKMASPRLKTKAFVMHSKASNPSGVVSYNVRGVRRGRDEDEGEDEDEGALLSLANASAWSIDITSNGVTHRAVLTTVNCSQCVTLTAGECHVQLDRTATNASCVAFGMLHTVELIDLTINATSDATSDDTSYRLQQRRLNEAGDDGLGDDIVVLWFSEPNPSSAGSQGDPHLRFAHGGRADFRGRNGTYYVLLSAPGVQCAAQTAAIDFLLPRPQLVHGSFFVRVAWTARGASGRLYGIAVEADKADKSEHPIKTTFRVMDARTGALLTNRLGLWRKWSSDGVGVYQRATTTTVRANGWEVNATRHPVYNHVAGASKWRYDLTMRPLDGTTGFEAQHGVASATCFPHGILGQSFDGDAVAVDGAVDDYAAASPVLTTRAMAEGAIEGVAADYALNPLPRFATDFRYARFDAPAGAKCAPRDVAKLTGPKRRFSGTSVVAAAVDNASNAI